jgi:acetoin utilization deacetylase AcuC-like enzyme
MHLIFDPEATRYGTPHHPECPERLIRAEAHLRKSRSDWTWSVPASATDDSILKAHSREHLERLARPLDFDADTPYYDQILAHARKAAGAAVEAVDHAFDGEKAFSLMRPPGHHAMRNRAMGFCYLNSIAVAALYAIQKGAGRVAIWDFDAHHGNGTEAIVHAHPAIHYSSIHQYPGYPGTGTHSFDNISNYPVPPYVAPDFHAGEVERGLARLLEFKPDLILVSAGFDAYAGDPITQMSLEAEHFELFGKWLRETGIIAGAILEGGYSGELPQLVESFLSGWSGSPGTYGGFMAEDQISAPQE